MNKKLLLATIFCAAIGLQAQTTATDFTATDCASGNHNLFAKLNDGKVVVICWVMPCGTCINPALTITTAVEGYASSNPGKVLYYLVDDYGNTNCSTLDNWASTNGIVADAMFSSSAVNMSDYGSAGMPKTVVLGGHNHEVFLNNNGALSASALKTAIDNALVRAGKEDPNAESLHLEIFPNPLSGDQITLRNYLVQSSDVHIRISSMTGTVVKELEFLSVSAGDFESTIYLESMARGFYTVSIQTASHIRTARLVVE